MKLSRALCRLACIPVGGSLVILMEFSRIPCGMMWPSGVEEGSALTNTLKFSWLPSACCSRSFSKVPSQRATKWIFCKEREKSSKYRVKTKNCKLLVGDKLLGKINSPPLRLESLIYTHIMFSFWISAKVWALMDNT